MDSWKKKPLFSYQEVPCIPFLLYWGLSTGQSLFGAVKALGWVEGENSVIWGGQSNLLGIANPTPSLREAQSVAEPHLWGWVRKGGSLPLLHSLSVPFQVEAECT